MKQALLAESAASAWPSTRRSCARCCLTRTSSARACCSCEKTSHLHSTRPSTKSCARAAPSITGEQCAQHRASSTTPSLWQPRSRTSGWVAAFRSRLRCSLRVVLGARLCLMASEASAGHFIVCLCALWGSGTGVLVCAAKAVLRPAGLCKSPVD